MKLLIAFATSYFCETRISAVAMIKSKCQSQTNVDYVMNVARTKFSQSAVSSQVFPVMAFNVPLTPGS
jgi:hypothetical protein